MEPESKKNLFHYSYYAKRKMWEDVENWITQKTDKNVNYYSICFLFDIHVKENGAYFELML